MADDGSHDGLQPGDLCHHGSNLLPTYRVVWIDGDKAWLRDVNTNADAVVTVGQCHRMTDLQELPQPGPEPEGSGPTGLTWPDGTPRP